MIDWPHWLEQLQNAGLWFWISLGLLLAGCLGAWLMRRWARRQTAAAFEAGLQQSAALHQESVQQLEQQITDAAQTHAADQARSDTLQQQLDLLQQTASEQQGLLLAAQTDVAASQARLDQAQKGFAEKEALFKQSSQQLKEEFELLANRVFQSQGERHQASLQSVLTPFKDQIVDFKKRVEEVYHSDTKERASLLAEIKNLQNASERINTEAENLTKALKGDKKLQGNWGELVLERVLEESGLRKDH